VEPVAAIFTCEVEDGPFSPVLVVVIVRADQAGDAAVKVKDPLVVARPLTSVALTVKVDTPADPPRVPDISPEEDKESPVGKAPEAIV
jgi:hypothetical protein